MYKEEIEVPDYVKHVSDWIGYSIPEGRVILDKDVTGCGYTEFCLRNNQNVILCSPRKMLLINKAEQHSLDQNILYIKNEMRDYDGAKSFEDEVKDHIVKCIWMKAPCKLMVTYDSTHLVVKVLKEMGVLSKFFFVVDEFQSIFLDSYFKCEVELDFVEYLQDCQNILYLSATPMLDKYMEKLDYFRDLPFCKLNWEKTGIMEKLKLKKKFATSLTDECSKIIQSYLNGKYVPVLAMDGQPIYSTEAVFYFNSVKDIVKVIKKNGLKPEQVNILCAETKDNIRKLQALTRTVLGKYYKGIKFALGSVPLEKDRDNNKMFTFCTKSAYIGSDFHSRCARSFVFSDPNITSLALDIALDLPQIAGRQRDLDNPFKNDITVFYRTIRKNEMSDKALFDKLQADRKQATFDLLNLYNRALDREKGLFVNKLKDSIVVSQYSEDYISISKHTNQPVYNNLIEVANERAWEVCQKEYQDIINVTKAMENISDGEEISEYRDESEKIAQDFLDKYFYRTGIFEEKMRLYCEFMDHHKRNTDIEEIIYYKIQDSRFRTYYNFYGTSGCRACSYKDANLSRNLMDVTKEEILHKTILGQFSIGEKYSKKDIKRILKTIYQSLDLKSYSAKATDLGRYFNISRTVIIENKDRLEGFRIDSIK